MKAEKRCEGEGLMMTTAALLGDCKRVVEGVWWGNNGCWQLQRAARSHEGSLTVPRPIPVC